MLWVEYLLLKDHPDMDLVFLVEFSNQASTSIPDIEYFEEYIIYLDKNMVPLLKYLKRPYIFKEWYCLVILTELVNRAESENLLMYEESYFYMVINHVV